MAALLMRVAAECGAVAMVAGAPAAAAANAHRPTHAHRRVEHPRRVTARHPRVRGNARHAPRLVGPILAPGLEEVVLGKLHENTGYYCVMYVNVLSEPVEVCR